ncbi:MAG: formylmethanofuran dehydrogenase subunit B, partial [Methanohalophilus sp.]
FDKTDYINRVSFEEEKTDHGPQCSVVEVLKEKRTDAALIIGSDPLSSLPGSIASNLKEIPTIVIDPCKTFTSQIANVTIPAAVTGVECNGEAIRMDGIKVKLKQMKKSDKMADAEILEKIMEVI